MPKKEIDSRRYLEYNAVCFRVSFTRRLVLILNTTKVKFNLDPSA